MTITIPDIMREIRNYFPYAALDGCWQLDGGKLLPDSNLGNAAWVCLEGAVQSGVHPLENGIIPNVWDESWTGRVWLLSPPNDFLQLCQQIIDWCSKQPAPSAQSESFGAYSRTALTVSGKPLMWQDVFASALRPYRQMFSEVQI